MKLVVQYGEVFSLSNASYKKMLKAIVAGEDYDLPSLGKCLGQIAAYPLDMGSGEALWKLKEI